MVSLHCTGSKDPMLQQRIKQSKVVEILVYNYFVALVLKASHQLMHDSLAQARFRFPNFLSKVKIHVLYVPQFQNTRAQILNLQHVGFADMYYRHSNQKSLQATKILSQVNHFLGLYTRCDTLTKCSSNHQTLNILLQFESSLSRQAVLLSTQWMQCKRVSN